MTSPTFFRLVATLDQLPSFRGQWSRFVRWALWGQHARNFSFPPASVAIEQRDTLRQLRAPSMHTI
jgi:hypothetical protein